MESEQVDASREEMLFADQEPIFTVKVFARPNVEGRTVLAILQNPDKSTITKVRGGMLEAVLKAHEVIDHFRDMLKTQLLVRVIEEDRAQEGAVQRAKAATVDELLGVGEGEKN